MSSIYLQHTFILWLVLLLPPCINAVYYDGKNKGLTVVPSDISSNVRIINLNDNKVSQIQDYAFSRFQQLAALWLGNNDITNISHVAFKDTGLEKLYLYNNKLEAVPDICIISKTMNRLNLYHNNIEVVDPRLINCLVNINWLSLSTNPFTQLSQETFKNLVNLKFLYISDTSLVSPPILHNAQLTYLMFMSTKITSFPDPALTNSNITDILNLRDLNLVCNCSIAWLLMSVERGWPEKQYTGPKCLSPSVFEGKEVRDLTISDLCPGLTKLWYIIRAKGPSVTINFKTQNTVINKTKPVDHYVVQYQNKHDGRWLNGTRVTHVRCVVQVLTVTQQDLDPEMQYELRVIPVVAAGEELSATTKLTPCMNVVYYDGKNKGLTVVPSDISKNVTTINLINNHLSEIQDYAFSRFHQLAVLCLGNSDISDISQLAFKDTGLEKLYLYSNKLVAVPNICIISKTLNRLDLDDNNIKVVDPRLISCLVNINWLILSNNPFSQLSQETFKNLVNLKFLYINDNSLISPPILHNAQLTYLRFMCTKITSFPDPALTNSRITHILNIQGLNLVCNCSIAWLLMSVERGWPETQYWSETKCASPPVLEGKKVRDLNISDLCPGLTKLWQIIRAKGPSVTINFKTQNTVINKSKPVDHYVVQYQNKDDGRWLNGARVTPVGCVVQVLTVTQQDLVPEMQYELRVIPVVAAQEELSDEHFYLGGSRALIGGTAGGFLVLLVLLITGAVIYMRKRRNNLHDDPKHHIPSGQTIKNQERRAVCGPTETPHEVVYENQEFTGEDYYEPIRMEDSSYMKH